MIYYIQHIHSGCLMTRTGDFVGIANEYSIKFVDCQRAKAFATFDMASQYLEHLTNQPENMGMRRRNYRVVSDKDAYVQYILES